MSSQVIFDQLSLDDQCKPASYDQLVASIGQLVAEARALIAKDALQEMLGFLEFNGNFIYLIEEESPQDKADNAQTIRLTYKYAITQILGRLQSIAKSTLEKELIALEPQ